ncbi:MAG: hypothetical protein VX871_01565 [Pseudomonadota bacterium]|nr:hypothetical protein [Pseudomonadota bacterium]
MTDAAHRPASAGPDRKPAPAPTPVLRRMVLVIAGAEALFLLFYISVFAQHLFSGESLSRNIAQAALVIAAIPLVLLVLPALALAIMNRALKLALAFALLALPVGVVMFLFA